MMNHWIFSAQKGKSKVEELSARCIFEQRMQDEFWGLGENTPNRYQIARGDKIVFYLAGKEKVFCGTATAASEYYELGPEEQEKYSHGGRFVFHYFGVRLTETDPWPLGVPVREIKEELGFITNKDNWGAHFQGGVRRLPEEDYQKILEAAGVTSRS
ncbi:MAG: EVE domain-containing protein [Anaerolineales bacterium]|nr:EVE domain-containing protein [Anaerolineales bacterium]